jgi:hypothetical protein
MDDRGAALRSRLDPMDHLLKKQPGQAMTSEIAANYIINSIKRNCNPGDVVDIELEPKQLRIHLLVNEERIDIIHFYKSGNFIPETVIDLVKKGLK